MKRIQDIILVFVIIFNCCFVNFSYAAESSLIAEAILARDVKQKGFSKIEAGMKTVPIVVERENSECWLLDNQSGEDSVYINFVLDNGFKHKKQDGSVYEIDVEYYDTGFGYFVFQYDSLDKDKQLGDIIYMNNDKMWKTAHFTIDDAEFNCNLDGKFDFRLGIKAKSSTFSSQTSSSSIGIRKVTVERKEAVNPIWVISASNKEGNAFEWFSEEKTIQNKFENLTNERKEVTITHKLINENDYVAYEKKEELVFEPQEIKETKFDFSDLKRCDVYDYYIEVKDKDGNINSSIYTMNLAILKTDPNGIVEERIEYSAHFDHTDDRLAHKAMWEVLKLGNIGTIRFAADWQFVEPTEGILKYPEFIKLINQDIRDNGFIKSPGGFFYSPTWISGGITLPKGEKELAAWEKFVRFAIDEQKDICDRYEIWNEPNVENFNRNLAEHGPDVYMDAFKVAAKVIQEKDPGALVGGPSITGIQYSEARNYWKECLEYGLAEVENAAIVLHPYTVRPIEKSGMIEDVLKYKKEFIEAGGSEDVELWHTELGYTLPDAEVGTEKVKGALNTRSAIAYYTHDLGDILNFYNFERKGYVKTDREDMFGTVGYNGVPERKNEKRCTPTVSYIQMTALTYILANSYIDSYYTSENGNLYMSVFNSEKFGNKIITLHTIDDAENVTIDLGTDEVILFDENGNETKVYGNNGIFTFSVGNCVQYIMGDISKSTIIENSKFINYSSSDIIVAENDIFLIEIENHTNKNYDIVVDIPQNINLVENNGFENGKAKLLFENRCEKGQESFVIVNIKDGDKIVQQSKITLQSEVLMTSDISVQIDNINDSTKWKGTIKIKNHSATQTLTGDIDFISNDMFSEIKPLELGIIPPLMTGEVQFALPNVTKKGQYYPRYRISLKNGLKIKFGFDVEAARSIRLDGKINESLEINDNIVSVRVN